MWRLQVTGGLALSVLFNCTVDVADTAALAPSPDTSTVTLDTGPATPDAGSPDAGSTDGPADMSPNIAGPCEDQDECPNGLCVMEYPGGYCQVTCASHDDCDDGLCLNIGAPEMACLSKCDQINPCRDGWFCSGVVCLPIGAIAAGPCTDEWKCLDPGATCLSSFPGGGFCSAACQVGGDVCEMLGDGLRCVDRRNLPEACFNKCSQGNEGSCRDGYVCSSLPDGGYACLPDCRQYNFCVPQMCNRRTGLCGE